MRRARHLSPSAETSASTYHCIDRVVNRDHVLGRVEKDKFLYLMRKYAAYHDVSVISFCVMDNHFHLLVEVPPKKKGAPVPMEDEVFLAKLKAFASRKYFLDVEQMLMRFRKGGSHGAAEELKAKHTCRMKDLSCFMQGLKRRFSQWFNREHGRTGTLWEGRFKSVLVESGYAARVMSAYIDLNPIRAGMVSRPEDYRWSSYGVAMGSTDNEARVLARAGLCRVMQLNLENAGCISPRESAVRWDEVSKALSVREDKKSHGKTVVKTKTEEGIGAGMEARLEAGLDVENRPNNRVREVCSGSEWYRMMLFADGEETFTAIPARGIEKVQVRRGFNRSEVEKILSQGGKLTFGEALRCKIRYFTDGMVFGTRDFVDGVFRGSRNYFSEKRKNGARLIRGVAWKRMGKRVDNTEGKVVGEGKEKGPNVVEPLYSMRDLKKEVLE